MCNSCYQVWWKREHPERFKSRPRRPAPCHPDKPVLAQDLCEVCYRAKWRSENPERDKQLGRAHKKRAYKQDPKKHRDRARAYRYGMTVAEVDALRESQGGRCAACGYRPDNEDFPAIQGGGPNPRLGNGSATLQIDHCHKTGKNRGMLCGNCNSALGHVNDDIKQLEALIAYLERWSE